MPIAEALGVCSFKCGFQSPGHGFFYIPNLCAPKQNAEKTNNVVITIIEGAATVKEIEHEFNGFFLINLERKSGDVLLGPLALPNLLCGSLMLVR